MQRLKDLLGSKEDMRARTGSSISTDFYGGGEYGRENGGGGYKMQKDPKGFLVVPGILEVDWRTFSHSRAMREIKREKCDIARNSNHIAQSEIGLAE